MDTERQKDELYQQMLFEDLEEGPRHDVRGDGGTEAATSEVSQVSAATARARALTITWMDKIAYPRNLHRAFQRVTLNEVAPGLDAMTVRDLSDWLTQYREELIASLLDGSYRPQPVR